MRNYQQVSDLPLGCSHSFQQYSEAPGVRHPFPRGTGWTTWRVVAVLTGYWGVGSGCRCALRPAAPHGITVVSVPHCQVKISYHPQSDFSQLVDWPLRYNLWITPSWLIKSEREKRSSHIVEDTEIINNIYINRNSFSSHKSCYYKYFFGWWV